MAERRDDTDDNPFRMYSTRNVLARARERLQLVRHWLIKHEPDNKGPEPVPSSDQDDPKNTG